MTTDELFELMSRDESLHPDLVPFVSSSSLGMPMVHHKWVIQVMFNSKKCGLINKQYETKKAEIENAKATKNFSRFIGMHERPYRLNAYLDILPDIVATNDRKKEAELFRYIWTDTENFFQNAKTWRKLWNSMCRDYVMTDEEKAAFANMNDPLTIYRGTRHINGKRGLSWTPDKQKAIWFANRFNGPSKILLTGTLKKKYVRAYLDDRETEVVAFPWHVQHVQEAHL